MTRFVTLYTNSDKSVSIGPMSPFDTSRKYPESDNYGVEGKVILGFWGS